MFWSCAGRTTVLDGRGGGVVIQKAYCLSQHTNHPSQYRHPPSPALRRSLHLTIHRFAVLLCSAWYHRALLQIHCCHRWPGRCGAVSYTCSSFVYRRLINVKRAKRGAKDWVSLDIYKRYNVLKRISFILTQYNPSINNSRDSF